MKPYYNQHLLTGDEAPTALREIVGVCEQFAFAIPEGEPAQAESLQQIIARTGSLVRTGALRLCDKLPGSEPVIRLYKAPAGAGRLKLQLFPLRADDAHPPHAHHNLISCQVVLTGRARIREYSLLRRLAAGELEIREEPEQLLKPGEGVYTLRMRKNIHWQEGLRDNTVLLNINWQGYFDDDPMTVDRAINGRCYIDWKRARPGSKTGTFIVPEVTGS